MHWDRHAACRSEDPPVDPSVFFPEGSESEVLEHTAHAKAVCRRCPAIAPCLADALDRDERHGIWGGLDEDERLELVRAAGEEKGSGAARSTAA
ncbi:WhiB family transcriptional regulator [Streptomyces bacillaris]|uniref:WhiB family transcriptional regulator n=1 Tax=Streptomyces bacillaris TaxID=68179 RepID=UPI00362845CE